MIKYIGLFMTGFFLTQVLFGILELTSNDIRPAFPLSVTVPLFVIGSCMVIYGSAYNR